MDSYDCFLRGMAAHMDVVWQLTWTGQNGPPPKRKTGFEELLTSIPNMRQR
jgi:hypothetical protein